MLEYDQITPNMTQTPTDTLNMTVKCAASRPSCRNKRWRVGAEASALSDLHHNYEANLWNIPNSSDEKNVYKFNPLMRIKEAGCHSMTSSPQDCSTDQWVNSM